MRYGIYSCGGFGRELLPAVRRNLGIKDPESVGDQVVFVDDDPTKVGQRVNGVAVISFDDLANKAHKDRVISVTIADAGVRKMIVNRCAAEGFEFFSIFDEGFSRGDNVKIGVGAIFGAHTMVTADVEIGQHFHCNIFSYVSHDCRIGDFVTFAPRVACSGRIEIDDMAYIGAGACIKQGVVGRPLRIGHGAVVGMGSVVLTDVPPNTVVAGNPARVIKSLEGSDVQESP